MKELSIEDKAKRYDEAIEKARDIYTYYCDDREQLRKIESIFPELKESESDDERIRKEIITYLSTVDDKELIPYESWIAWLEKQGEQKSANKVEHKFEIGDFITNGILVGKIDEINKLGYHAYFGDYYADVPDVENWHKWTIKDAKDGDVLTTDAWTFIFKKYQDRFVCYHCAASVFNSFSISDTDEFDSNYVHPATKEQRDLLFQKVKEAGYEWDAEKKELKKVEYKHICELDNSFACVKFPFRARVKSSGKIVTIFDGQLSESGKEWIKYQSDKEDYYSVYEPDDLEFVCNVEQKLAEKYNITSIGSKNAQGKLGEMIKNLKPVNEVLKQNPAWSEDDEYNNAWIVETLLGLDGDKEYSDTCRKMADWVKSLKDRVQPKQEWSEEDGDIRDSIIRDLKRLSGDMISPNQTYQKEIQWLKSLRPQNTWKPSNEQIEALDFAVGCIVPAEFCVKRKVLKELLAEIKKLREE